MRLALVALLSLLAAPSFASAFTFLGQLGDRDIVVELTQPGDGAVAGRFSYLDTGGDIPLVPVSHNDGLWVLNEEAVCGEADCVLDESGEVVAAPVAAIWEVRFDHKSLAADVTRKVQGGKAKPQLIYLETLAWRPLDEHETATAMSLHERSFKRSFADSAALDWTNAPYEMALMEVALEEGDIEALGEAEYKYVIDPRTKFAFPRAVSLPDGETVEPINAILTSRHAKLNLAAFDCLALQYASYGVQSEWSIRGGHLGDYDSETVTLSYLSPQIVSWTEAGSLWCTGAHPYNHLDSFSYDVATGKPLDMTKVFSAWVPREWGAASDAIVSAETAAPAPNEYRWGPSPELITFVRKTLPSDVLFDEPEMDDVCFGDQAIANHLDIRFAPGPSVVFSVSGYPHVMSVCGTDLVTVPLAELTPFLAPTAADYFPELD